MHATPLLPVTTEAFVRLLGLAHLVSDSNDDISDPARKFSEAAKKLVDWNRMMRLDTAGIKAFEAAYRSQMYSVSEELIPKENTKSDPVSHREEPVRILRVCLIFTLKMPPAYTKTEVLRKASVLERKKELADVELSRLLRKPGKRNGAGFF